MKYYYKLGFEESKEQHVHVFLHNILFENI